MRAARTARRFVVLVLLLGSARPAHATIDLTGHWNLTIDFFGTVYSQAWDIAQTGTALTQTPSSPGQTGPRTGTIDSTSGAFTLADPMSCHPAIGPSSCNFSGTAAPDRQTFTGTLNCSAPTPTECGDGPASVTAARAPVTCGNGVVDPGEQCDGGAANGMPGSCCSLACQFAAAGTSCDTSGNLCGPHDVCDGAGHCGAGGPPVTCDPCSACDPASGDCLPSPATDCRPPTAHAAASLLLETSGPRLRWKWGKGAATSLADFGDPVGTDPYTLCVYDESVGGQPTTKLDLAMLPGAAWRAKSTGFAYKDKLGSAGGVAAITLKAGAAGKAKVTLTAGGPNLALPPLPLVVPVRVQLRGHGRCWGARYDASGLKKATSAAFVARSSPSGAFLE